MTPPLLPPHPHPNLSLLLAMELKITPYHMSMCAFVHYLLLSQAMSSIRTISLFCCWGFSIIIIKLPNIYFTCLFCLLEYSRHRKQYIACSRHVFLHPMFWFVFISFHIIYIFINRLQKYKLGYKLVIFKKKGIREDGLSHHQLSFCC